jgi:hypothetical protein
VLYDYLTTITVQNQYFEEIGPAGGKVQATSYPVSTCDPNPTRARFLYATCSRGGEENGGCRLRNANRFNLINHIVIVFRKVRLVLIPRRKHDTHIRRNQQGRHNGETEDY